MTCWQFLTLITPLEQMIMTSNSFALLLFNKSRAELANNSQAKQKQNHIRIWEKVSILDCSDFNPQEGGTSNNGLYGEAQASAIWEGRDFTSWSVRKGREIGHFGLWNSLPADVLWGSFVTHSLGEKWMRDKRTPKDVRGEAIRKKAHRVYGFKKSRKRSGFLINSY